MMRVRVPFLAILLVCATPSSACDGTFAIYKTWTGATHLNFEDQYTGYSPLFGSPMVAETLDSNPVRTITIVQPVTDIADSTQPDAAAPAVFCHGEDLDLGILPDSIYALTRYDQLTVNGATMPLRLQDSFNFVAIDGSMQCASSPRFGIGSPIVGKPFEVSLNLISNQAGIDKVLVGGNTVTIVVGPVPSFPSPTSLQTNCATFKANVPALAAGNYNLVWRLAGQQFTIPFTVIPPPPVTRQRAVRH